MRYDAEGDEDTRRHGARPWRRQSARAVASSLDPQQAAGEGGERHVAVLPQARAVDEVIEAEFRLQLGLLLLDRPPLS